MALAGSLDREADARLEQEPGVEGKTKKLTRYGVIVMMVMLTRKMTKIMMPRYRE